ncbi:MAG: glycosyl transferase [Bradyrhizobiaceae bacterium]|nr:glycosyl transferase [Bradyrhizobiaceae bacterium]
MIAAAWGCSAALILLMLPMFRRYALARPNARSSHQIPTPQGGGLAVVLAVAIALGVNALIIGPESMVPAEVLPLGAAVVLLTAVGGVDDVFPLSARLRLSVQAAAVALAVLTMPDDLRALPVLPVAVERAAEIAAGLWFVNLVNFMDGIDWMTVAETVPSTACLFVFALFAAVPGPAGPVALALCGAVLGFAPFNRPTRAKLFLGDVGSLPIGLLLFWLLLQLAGSGHLAAAMLLPLYYVADATVTLLRRFARGERLTEAHRSHFYQLAVIRGLPVMTVVQWVFAINAVLAVLAALSIFLSSGWFDLAALVGGGVLVAVLLMMMERGRR